MMYVSALGRLGQDPRSIETKSGKPMCVASMAVDLLDKNGESHTQWMNVVAFGKVADLLGRQRKGDLASLSGRCQANRWTNADGQLQVGLSIIVDSVVSSRSVQRAGNSGQSQPNRDFDDDLVESNQSTDGVPFDDEIPF